MDMEKVFRTKDLYEASFLLAEGQTLINLEKENVHYWFVFAEQSSSELLANTYWNGKAIVNARVFVDAIRNLKDRIFANK